MTDAHDPTESGHPAGRPGQHRLGPHVVGQRVVVRRVLPGETGPTGGPAMTDVLGFCQSWADGQCVVQPRDGDPVTISIADIVSGKPVPAKPSVRMRASTAECESHTVSLFPGAETTPVGGWTLRWEPSPAGRVRKRANSCLAVTDPGMPVPEALAQVAAFYAARDRPPLVQVELGSPLGDEVAAAGWQPVPGDADFLVTSAAMLRRELRGVDGVVDLVEDDGGALATVGVSTGSTTDTTATVDATATTDTTATTDATATTGPWATARAVLDGDWLGIHDVHVAPYHRRQGLAKLLMSELLDWGAAQGARTVWLHVETDNVAALALYEGLGFTRHHTCGYLAPAT